MLNADMITETIPEMIGLREAARRTGLSYGFLRRLCLSGQIVYVRAGSKFLINWQRFVDYLNRGDGVQEAE